MATNNITFPIYNENGTPFHNLVLRKGVVDSVVMSLGDKINGDVFYKDNTLEFTMKEYVEYNNIHYSLVNPPTIVREGMVADNNELKGMAKYSFEFYHPMYQLGNFPFTDVATKTGEEKYLSQNKTFSWIGKPQDYIDKLNKNLQGTVWYVRKSDRFPIEKDDELSEVQQFDNVKVSEAIKRGYEIWDVPYIVSQLPSTDPLYAQGKRFVVEYGLPSNEIYEDDSARQLDTPFVFHMGQGVGLKNNSRTPRNNKIVTRLAGYGSEDNVPYGYPQIVWYGAQNWKYTINNDKNDPNSYPIYDGIVGGKWVKLIKHPFTRTHLMPKVYGETLFNKVSPFAPRIIGTEPVYGHTAIEELVNLDTLIEQSTGIVKTAFQEFKALFLEVAEHNSEYRKTITTQSMEALVMIDDNLIMSGNMLIYTEGGREFDFEETYNDLLLQRNTSYNPNTTLVDYYDAVAGEGYPNPINLLAPSYESHEFADIKPEFDSERNIGIINAIPLNADLTPADHWDDSMDDDGNYLQSYFQITLPQLDFDLYACAAITQEMKINMRSGACIGCTFTVQVDWEDYKKNFYDSDGNFLPDGEQRDLVKYPKSNLGQISIIVQKDNTTFGVLMPNIYQQPKPDDLFVFIGISLPLSYITSAELRLDDAMKSYMLENNVFYFDYPLKFDEHFLATHTHILEQIRPNSIIHFNYGGVEQQLFVKQITVKYGNAQLPQYDITLTDNIEVVLNQIGQVANDVENLSSLISILRQSYSRNVWNEIAKKLSKSQDDVAQGLIGFVKGLWVKANGLFGISKDGDARVNDFEAIGSAIIGGNVTIDGILQAFAKVLTNKIESENWTGDGAFDTGFRLQKGTDGVTSMVVDNLFVRMKAIFTELEIRKISYAGGNIIFSHAGSKVVKVKPLYNEYYLYIPDGIYDERHEGINLDNGIYLPADEGLDLQTAYLIPTDSAVVTAYRCYILKDDGTTATENWWRVDDQARCQTFNVVEPGNYSHAENTYYWRRVIEVGMEVLEDGKTYDYVDLSATDCASYSDIPKEGDQLVQMGNRTDSTRQGFISIEVSGEDAPSFKVYKGVSGYTIENKRKICLSPSLTDLHVQKLTIETDYGVSSRVPVERGDWSGITDHKCYYYDIVQHNGSTWLCIVSEGSYTTDEPSVNSAYWRIYAQRGKDGEDGKSFSIKGSYDTYAELIAAHPTGEEGDAYIVGNDLYIWDVEREEWHNNGQFKGEDGNNYVSVYTTALSQPAAPSGTSVPPTGWFTDIPQITNVSAAGDFSEDNGWRKASGNHVANAFIKDTLTFTTTQPNQKVFIQIRPSSEGSYDIIAVGLLDTDLANRAAVSALDASRKTSGTEPKTVETTVATAGQHTLCIVYSKDANTDRREDSAWYRLAPVDVYISTAAFKGTVMQGAWSTPVRYSANGEDSINVVLSPSTLLVNQDMENKDNLSNLSEDVFVSVYKGAVPQVITSITLTGTTHCNASVGSNYVRLTAVHTDSNNKYYDNGNITFNVTYLDSDTQEIKSVANLVIRFNANLLGTWSESVIGETKQEIGRSTWFDVDPLTGNIVESQRLGNFIRSSQENTSRLEESNYFNIFTGNSPSFPISFTLSSSQITKYGSSYRLSLNVASDEGDLTIKVLKGSAELFVYQNVNDVLEEVMTGLTEGTYTITCNKTATVVSVGIYSTAANTDKYSQIKQTVDSIDLTVKGLLPSKNLFSGVLSAKGWKSATSSIVGSGIPVTVNDAVLGSDGFINANSGDSYIIGSAYISSYTPYTLSFYSKNTARLKITVFNASYPSMAQSWYIDAVSSANTRRTLSFQIGFGRSDLAISIESTSIIYPQLEQGTEATDFVASDTEISSAINMTADNIHAAVVSELGETGIDISGTNRNITLQADKVKFTNSAGTVDNKIWIDPTTGTLHAIEGDFEGSNKSGKYTESGQTKYANELNSDGSGKLAKGEIAWDANGNAEFSGAMKAPMVYSPNYEVGSTVNAITDVKARTFIKSRGSSNSTVYLPRASDYSGLEIQFFAPLLTRIPVGNLYVKSQLNEIMVPDSDGFYGGAPHGVKIDINNLVTFKAINQDWILVSGEVTILTS